MVLINIKIFNKFENLVILLSEQKFGDFGGGGLYKFYNIEICKSAVIYVLKLYNS